MARTGWLPASRPNSTLILDVELVSIERPNPPSAAAPPPPANPPLTSDIIKVPSAEEMKKGAKVEIIKPEDIQKLQHSRSSHHRRQTDRARLNNLRRRVVHSSYWSWTIANLLMKTIF